MHGAVIVRLSPSRGHTVVLRTCSVLEHRGERPALAPTLKEPQVAEKDTNQVSHR